MSYRYKIVLSASLALTSLMIWITPDCRAEQTQDPQTAGDSQAQQPETTAQALISEVVVTARKKEESLQKVPISVSAYSAAKMEALDITESGDIARFTPNFNWNTEYGKTSPQIYLRGVGSNNFMPNNTGPIAVYQDNVYHGPNVVHAFGVFDLDRVEVLKGPQGTLYGRNSTGGLINFISRKPEIGREANGSVSLEGGQYGTINASGAVGFPISDRLAGRVAFLQNRNRGMWDNDNPASGVKHSGNIDDLTVRAQLLFQPVEQVEVLFNYHDAKARTDVEPFKSVGFNCAAGTDPGFSLESGSHCPDLFGFRDTGDVWQTFKSDDQENLDARGGFVQLVYDAGPFTVTSLTSFDVAKHRRFNDSDGAPTIQLNVHFVDDFDYGSQELRISGTGKRFDWHAGAYYYHEVYDGFTLLDVFDLDPTLASGIDKKFVTESYAFFTEGNYQVTDKFRISAGLRWTSETKSIDRFQALAYNSTGRTEFIEDLDSLTGINEPVFFDIRSDRKKTFTKPTWRLSGDYSINEDVMVYASLATGFKGGEINGLPGISEPTKIIDPETLDAAELGVKSKLFDRHLVFNAAAFYYQYKDLQVATFSDQAGNPVAVLDNATNANIRGVDAEIEWAPTPEWFVNASLGVVKADYGRYFSPAAGALSGNRIAFVPKFKATLLVRREWPLSRGATFSVQGDLITTGDMYFQPTNDPWMYGPGYTIFNSSIQYRSAGDKWSLALIGKNISDKEYLVSGFNVGPPLFASQVKGGLPRYFGLKFDYRF